MMNFICFNRERERRGEEIEEKECNEIRELKYNEK